MYILDLQSKIRVTIATGPAKHRDKRGICYRTSASVSHSKLEIWDVHSHGMEAGWRLMGLCLGYGKGLIGESM